MIFKETPLKGAYVLELEKREDDRGFFARAFCEEEFNQIGQPFHVLQANNSLSTKKGTLRGMHYQLAPKAEQKLVRCVRGSLFDVILDLRENSPTFGQWFGETLTAENRKMMYVPKGFAHGFLTLEDNSEAFYFVSEVYAKDLERGLRFDDPKFGIQWPITPTVISDKDRAHPNFDPNYHLK